MDWRCVLSAWLALAAGCAAGGRDLSGVKVAAEGDQVTTAEVDVAARLTAAIAALELRVGDLRTELDTRIGTIDARVGDVDAKVSARIGGGGDSITAWLYAAIAGAAVLYPMVLRPIRRAWERRKRRQRRRHRTERRKIK